MNLVLSTIVYWFIQKTMVNTSSISSFRHLEDDQVKKNYGYIETESGEIIRLTRNRLRELISFQQVEDFEQFQ